MKRGQTDLSLLLAVDKPAGMTSHDVVNRVRSIFGEKRVGHAGTLDPMATGVLIVLVGPASRLNAHLESQCKGYEARICFGAATDTDDAEGAVIRTAPMPSQLTEASFAQGVLEGFLGPQLQMPPAYSAIKKDGVRSYAAARKGTVLHLEPRSIEVSRAELLTVGEEAGRSFWDVAFTVSKGTYIRSLARDIGKAAGTEAHLSALRRTQSGRITLEDCASLEALEALKARASLDPVKVLGLRFAYLEGKAREGVTHGMQLPSAEVRLHEHTHDPLHSPCACTAGVVESCRPPAPDEPVLMLGADCVLAVYRFNAASQAYVPDCVFSKGVTRGVI